MTDSSSTPGNHAVILFGHGSRDPQWHKPMEAVATLIRHTHPGVQVCCAYLELTQPDLTSACAELVQAGCHHIAVLPMFLGTGRHAREDLPRLADAVRAAHPGLQLDIRAAVGEDPRVLALLADIASEGLLSP